MALRAVVVGTAGHVDHGKTALVRALTGVETDRLREERERGLTIDLGFAPLDLGPDVEGGVVDVPGHEDFLRNMLAGASGVDVLLLAVAADEGPMPQTREHLAIARILGVDRGVVALTKADRVDAEWLQLAEDAVREELAATGIDPPWPVLPVSAVAGTGLEALREALREAAGPPTGRDAGDLFRLPVDRSFTVRGVGTVVTGTVWSGRVRPGDEVRLLPSDRTARVRTLQVHGREREEAGPGLRCALSLVGVARDDVGRGESVVAGKGWRPARRLGARVTVLPAAPAALEHAATLRLHLGTRDLRARVLLEDGTDLPPGATSWAVLDCAAPVVVRAGDRFVLRSLSPAATVGGGVVAEADPPRRWRERRGAWGSLVGDDHEAAVRAAVLLAAGRGLDPGDLPLLTGRRAEPEAGMGPGVVRVGDRLFAKAWPERARAAVLDLLASRHARRPRAAWAPLEMVRAGLERVFASVLVESALAGLVESGRVERRGADLRLTEHRPLLTETETRAAARLRETLRAQGLAPPDPDALAATTCEGDRGLLNDLLRILVEEGAVVAVGPDLYLDAGRERELREVATRVLAGEAPAPPSAFATETGLSRRQLIPLLEYLDRIGWTRRTGDGRVPGPAAPPSDASAAPDAQSR